MYSKRGSKSNASLDRIDSLKGYAEGNVQWVHKTVDQMKWNLSQEELVKWCRLILDGVENKNI